MTSRTLIELCWLLAVTTLSYRCLSVPPRKIFFITSLGTFLDSKDCSKIIGRDCNDISQLFENFCTNPIIPHRSVEIQLEQQILHNLQLRWEWIILTLWFSSLGHQNPLGASSVAKNVLNSSALSLSLLVR